MDSQVITTGYGTDPNYLMMVGISKSDSSFYDQNLMIHDDNTFYNFYHYNYMRGYQYPITLYYNSNTSNDFTTWSFSFTYTISSMSDNNLLYITHGCGSSNTYTKFLSYQYQLTKIA